MNSPYGSLDHLSDWSWYDPGWENTPSTDDDYAFDYDASPTCSGDFEQIPSTWPTSTWPTSTCATALTAPHHPQYDFKQAEQVWLVSDAQIDRQPQPLPLATQFNSSSMRMPHDGAMTATLPPPPTGLGITAADPCTYPRSTTVDQLPVAPELLQTLFPRPTLPRSEPPCLYDDDGQPLQKRNPRFQGDLYAALWTRGKGASREGWCGFCASWHRLKDSAYW